ncbi:pyridoxamine 5'-phosphate oxidase family protein [Yaniella flava]|uniref:pyridoxamine 5'-phosphate oxidase family protein n=1 Tax=Yaniella flava TaxID=287930 RepID=UPI0031DDDBB5
MDILQRIWTALHAATKQGTGFTLGFLGTVSNGGGPRIRAVILRRFDRSPDRIFFATHASAQKAIEIRDQPQVALTLQDNDSALQLRIEGTASVVEDPAQRRNAWESLAPHSQQLYASPEVPGRPLTQNVHSLVDDSEMRSAFERFAWIRIDLAWLDWLDLSTEPQQRWQFRLNEGSWRGQRVVP